MSKSIKNMVESQDCACVNDEIVNAILQISLRFVGLQHENIDEGIVSALKSLMQTDQYCTCSAFYSVSK